MFYARPHSTGSASQQDMLPPERKCRDHRSRSPIRVVDRTCIKALNHHGNNPTVNNTFVYGLKEANERTWFDMKGSAVFWLRDLMPESQPIGGWMMTSGYDAKELWKSWNKLKIPIPEIDDSQRRMDHAPKILDRRFDGNRDPVPRRDLDKDSQVISYYWDRTAPNPMGEQVVVCNDVFYTGQDEVLQDSSQVSDEQASHHSSPNRTGCSKYRELVDFPWYRRFHTAINGFITLAVVLGCPTIVSAAAIPAKCELSSNRSALMDWISSSNVILISPAPPKRQILQHLALCGMVSVLIYYQRTGPYLKYSFLACSGLLGLLCVSSGTETMLRFLPLVVLGTLLASWGCQVLAQIMGAFRPHENQNQLVDTTPALCYEELDDKHPHSPVT